MSPVKRIAAAFAILAGVAAPAAVTVTASAAPAVASVNVPGTWYHT